MIKAIFLDLDETLCDTSLADAKAQEALITIATPLFEKSDDASKFADIYLNGIYKRLSSAFAEKLFPVIDEHQYRRQLISLTLQTLNVQSVNERLIDRLQDTFDDARKAALDFYPGIVELLKKWRESFTLVVITNGPEFSQLLKIEAIHIRPLVDHIIIGGQEKEEKPAVSIFKKALALAGVSADEAIHFGDKLTTDVLGANNTGIQSVWVSHGRLLDTTLFITPNHILSHPDEMGVLVDSLIYTHRY